MLNHFPLEGNAMSKAGTMETLNPEELAKMRRISPVKALRWRLGMTQAEFAKAFRLPIGTLRRLGRAAQHS
jgi:DNA-binding transcriptional regulator YiaG